LRSARFLLPFFWRTFPLAFSARRAPGNLGVRLLRSRGLVFWRLTLWRDVESMEAFRQGALHRAVEPSAAHWFDEFALARWEQEGNVLPDWEEAVVMLQQHGRLVEVEHPSPSQQAGMIEIT